MCMATVIFQESWWQLCMKQLKEHGGDLNVVNKDLAIEFLKDAKIRYLPQN